MPPFPLVLQSSPKLVLLSSQSVPFVLSIQCFRLGWQALPQIGSKLMTVSEYSRNAWLATLAACHVLCAVRSQRPRPTSDPVPTSTIFP